MNRRLHAFGSTISIEAADPEFFHHLDQWLPPMDSADTMSAPPIEYRVVVSGRSSGAVVVRGRRTLAAADNLSMAARILAADLVVTLSRTSHVWTFVHAGVVAVAGRAIVLPGAPLSGKTTLVSALLRGGAEYGSDEFAAVGRDGRVRPWARWLGTRTAGRPDERIDPKRLGARTMANDVWVGAMVFTSYHAGARVNLQPIGAGHAALRTLQHCLTARARTVSTLRAVGVLTATAHAFESPRSDAGEFATRLLALAETLPPECRAGRARTFVPAAP